jgi:hypothetical protein
MNTALLTEVEGDALPLSDSDRERLEVLFNAGAARVEEAPEHWIHGDDEGTSYCPECAAKKLAELLVAEPDADYCVDGGWGVEGDTTPFCETCGKRLSNSFTNYACEEEVDHYLANGFDAKDNEHCMDLSKVIASRGWQPWEGRVYEREYQRVDDLQYFSNLRKLCRQILAQLDAAADRPLGAQS